VAYGADFTIANACHVIAAERKTQCANYGQSRTEASHDFPPFRVMPQGSPLPADFDTLAKGELEFAWSILLVFSSRQGQVLQSNPSADQTVKPQLRQT
jgi:hypothetical protein